MRPSCSHSTSRTAVQFAQDQYEEAVKSKGSEDLPLIPVGIITVNRATRPSSPMIQVIQSLPQQQKYLLCALTMLALDGVMKPTSPQIIRSCGRIPFAKTLRKPDVEHMLEQLRENGLISKKSTALCVDEDDVCFAFEDSPLARFLTQKSA